MYFPLLKVRGEEVEAILGSVCDLKSGLVIPILEPYYDYEEELYEYQNLLKVVGGLISAEQKFILIIDEFENLEKLREKYHSFDKYCIHGFYSSTFSELLLSKTTQACLIYDEIPEQLFEDDKLLYHIFLPATNRMTSFMDMIPRDKVVMIEDGFISYDKNSLYPERDRFNSELCFTYRDRGYAGFGDYTILPKDFVVPTGARPSTVTHVIHLTHNRDKNLYVYHYLTTPAMEPDIRTRSHITLKKAIKNIDMFLDTAGTRLLKEKYSSYSTSSGIYKRIGIMHHIELIVNLIK